MKIQIEVTWPRWLRLPRTWRGRSLMVALAAVAVAVPVAFASHQFDDVPNTNPHHDDVSAIFGARITAGCNPPTNNLYCPEQFVRRDQMGSFLRRGLGRAGMAGSGPYTWLTHPTYSDLAVLTITPGGTTGGTGFVVVQAVANAYQPAGASTEPSMLTIHISRDGGGVSDPMYETLTPTSEGQAFPNISSAQTWVFQVPSGVPQTFRLRASIAMGPGPMGAYGRLTAIYVPFGSTGAATLGEAAVESSSDN